MPSTPRPPRPPRPDPGSPSALDFAIVGSIAAIEPAAWDELLAAQPAPTPFLRHAYLAALEASGSATPETGWTPAFATLRAGGELVAACPLYLKPHSYGEYVFDWAWARAYAEHGLDYYPKAVCAVPFTPVPGTRLLARNAAAREALVRALVAWCEAQGLSSLHLLFGAPADVEACARAGLMLRQTVQFHWHDRAGADGGWRDFDDFLASLAHDKRKKIRQERRKVAEAGVTFRWARGRDISSADWAFFYRCYARTYREHGNPPYLTRDFFAGMAAAMPGNWLLFIAERASQPIASSLIALGPGAAPAGGPFDAGNDTAPGVAYGRYWGALERVDCLHFEACYNQPLAWCIAHGIARFEGGAQGEHKMARALMPTATTSAHWLARPDFADAVERFLAREGEHVEAYLEHLAERSPFRHAPGADAGD